MSIRDRETLLRLVRIPKASHPLPILAGEPPKPIPACTLAISHTTNALGRPEYILYFLDRAGRVLEFDPCETMRIALDQAHAYVGVKHDDWVTCKVEVPEGGEDDPLIEESLLRDV